MGSVILLCVYFFIQTFERMFIMFKDAGGIWHSDRFRPLITSVINVGLNILMVQFIQIYGVILSTVIATVLVSMPWLLYNMFSGIFSMDKLAPFVRHLLRDGIMAAAVTAVTYLSCVYIRLEGVVGLLVKGGACFGISNLLLLALWGRRWEFSKCIGLAKRQLLNKNLTK